jgi:hypothetical protein
MLGSYRPAVAKSIAAGREEVIVNTPSFTLYDKSFPGGE